MNLIRRVLFRLLGIKNYLKTISKLFFMVYDLGLLKRKALFECHYFIKKLVKQGDVVIDLGANLGYYSRNFARIVKENGHVYSIEPVKLFQEVLEKNTRKYKQVTILPYAIGENDGQEISMGVPSSSKYFSHGKTHVIESNDEAVSHTFPATMKRPENLFHKLDRLDYIKCDIEGYEGIAIPLFKDLFIQFRPILQVELANANRVKLFNFFGKMDYQCYMLKEQKLYKVASSEEKTSGDLFFIPNEKIDLLKPYFA